MNSLGTLEITMDMVLTFIRNNFGKSAITRIIAITQILTSI